jgi:hypothetical protein
MRDRRSDDALKQIARDLVAGHIFTDRDIPRARTGNLTNDTERAFDYGLVADQIRMVFIPLTLADQATLDRILAMKPVLFYEYWNKALPHMLNGMPMFASVRYITEEEWPTLTRYLQALWDNDPLKGL